MFGSSTQDTFHMCLQANQVGHLVCGGCQITLMYAFGAQSVKCAVCNHVTPVAASPGRAGQQGSSSKPAQQAVLVQNPPSLDDAGNEVRLLCFGDSLGCGCQRLPQYLAGSLVLS
jgi:LSD1 subclass zinc finger protein